MLFKNLRKKAQKVRTSIESWSPLEAFAGNQSRNHFGTLFIAFLGYAIEGGLALDPQK